MDKADNHVVLPRNTTLPLYQQIQDTIEEKINSGEWVKGTKIPSENTLVEELGVSRMTINRALRELTQKGYLERAHGLGTFVVQPPRHTSLIEITDIAEAITEEGKQHHAEIWLLQSESSEDDVAERMEIKPGSNLYHITMLHYQNDVPIQIENRWVSPIVPEFLNLDFKSNNPTQYLMERFRPEEIEHIVTAKLPDEDAQEMLAISREEPCLCLSKRTWRSGGVVTYVNFTSPGSRFELGSKYPTKT